MKRRNIKITLEGSEDIKINFAGYIGINSQRELKKEELKLYVLKEFSKILDEYLIDEEK